MLEQEFHTKTNEGVLPPENHTGQFKTALPELELLQKELQEKNILLSLNNDIASTRNRQDMLEKVHPKLRQLFNVEDIFICALDRQGQTLNPFVRVVSKRRLEYPGYEALVNANFPIHDGFIDVILNAGQPVIFDIAAVNKWKPRPPDYMAISLAAGLAETLSVALYHAGDKIGILTLWSAFQNSFTPHHLKLIKSIADQVSILIINILANEEIEKRDKEKEILLSISNEIATIRGKDDLLHVISDTLKQHMRFNDSFILSYNKKNNTYKAFIYHVEKGRLEDPQFKSALDFEYPVNDNDITNTHIPQVSDVSQLLKTGVGQVAFVQKTGIRELVSIKLMDGNQLIGLFVLSAEQKNSFSAHDLNLLQRISYQVSIATAKIIANEEIQRREEEKSILLSLSNDMALVRNKEDLAKIINQKLKKLFLIEDFTIVATHATKMTYGAYLFDPEDTPYKKKQEYLETLFNSFKFEEGFYDVVLKSETPVIFDIEKTMNQEVVPGHIEFFNSLGIKEIIGTSLSIGNENIGILWIQPEQPHSFDRVNQNVFKGVCSQISVALANIISNEELQASETEKAIMLSIGNDIASIRNRTELLRIITHHLKKLFNYNDASIIILDKAKKYYSAFVLDMEERRTGHEDCLPNAQGSYPINDGICDVILKAGEPIVLDYEEALKHPHAPSWASFLYKTGIKQMVSVALREGNEDIGAFFLHSESKDHFKKNQLSLVQGIAYQLSIALANVLANEDIREREKEKSILLSFSNDIATVRDKKGLSAVIKKYLQKQFGIKEYIITIKNDDGETYGYFLHDLPSEDPKDEGFKIVTGPKMPIKGAMTGVVLQSEEPVIFNIAEIEREGKLSFPAASFWKSAGAEKIFGMRLRVAAEDIGIIWTQPNQINDNLLKGISAQIAIAIANTTANEKNAMQLEEIKIYKQKLEDENLYLQQQIETAYNYGEIVGAGAAMQKVFQLISQVAFADTSVLLLGETGTGKELVAHAIHSSSPRKDKLMIKVNCATLPANLIESELFGHEKGSFTGAIERRIGKFELANHGTLFLDEIGEMPLELQVKLLRALQEKEIERVGGKTIIKVNVRIITATNRDLQKEVDEGRFRSDLFYRLNVFPITLPPLRERKEDIPILAAHFIEKFSKNSGKQIKNISGKAMNELMLYSWPGNVRELEHLVERSLLINSGNIIKDLHLPGNNRKGAKVITEDDFLKTYEQNEREYIIRVLTRCKGKIFGPGGAAEILGLKVSTLNSKMQKLGIRKEKTFTSP